MFELGIELNKIGVDEKSICHVLKPAVNLDFIAENAKINMLFRFVEHHKMYKLFCGEKKKDNLWILSVSNALMAFTFMSYFTQVCCCTSIAKLGR